MDHIDQHLATAAIGNKYNPAIRAALAIGKKTLNRYYDRTDHSEVYRIAMSTLIFHLSIFSLNTKLYIVLHPRHKLEYFKKAGWEASWIKAAEEILRRVRPLIPLSWGSWSWHKSHPDGMLLLVNQQKVYIQLLSERISQKEIYKHIRWPSRISVSHHFRRDHQWDNKIFTNWTRKHQESRCSWVVVWTQTHLPSPIPHGPWLSHNPT